MLLCKLFSPLCVLMIGSWPAEMGYVVCIGNAVRPATFHYMHVLNYPQRNVGYVRQFRQQSSPYLFPCINVSSVHDVCASTFIPRWTLFFCQQRIADFVKSSVADWITRLDVRVRASKFSPASFQAIKLFGHRWEKKTLGVCYVWLI